MPQRTKEERKQYMKEYRQKNKDKINQRRKEYVQTPQGIKSKRITNWKQYGVICEDFDVLYQKYIDTTNCENCDILLTYDKRTTCTTKCMDHCHETGEFRNILCNLCNIRRK
jgi:hypothetical protein